MPEHLTDVPRGVRAHPAELRYGWDAMTSVIADA